MSISKIEKNSSPDVKKSKSKFNFCGKGLFLTYKSHLDPKVLGSFLTGIRSDLRYEAVHETADDEHPYLHTHVHVYFPSKIHIRNSRKLDLGDIHPHIKFVKTRDHFNNLLEYVRKETAPFFTNFTGNERLWRGGDREAIQAHTSWASVMNDDTLEELTKNNLNWCKEVFRCRPRPKTHTDVKLRKWQEFIVKRLDNQNDREVLWVADSRGGHGKSWLTDWLLDNRSTYFFNGGKFADIAYAFDNQEYVVVDIPKSTSDDFVPYKAIESFKDGRITSSKYMSFTKKFKKCKVIVFSNHMPDTSKLIADRWDIIDISNVVEISTKVKIPKVVVPKVLNINGDFLLPEKSVPDCPNNSSIGWLNSSNDETPFEFFSPSCSPKTRPNNVCIKSIDDLLQVKPAID